MTSLALEPTPDQYLALAAFAHTVRKVLADSEFACSAAGLTAHRFQALLVIRTLRDGAPVAVSDLARELGLKTHSVIDVVRRLEVSGLVARDSDSSDRRRVLLTLTEAGTNALAELTQLHLRDYSRTNYKFVEVARALVSAK